MRRSRAVGIASIALGLIFVYVAGVGIRQRYGIHVEIENESHASLRDVRIDVRDRGGRYLLGEISAGEKRGKYIQPETESHVDLSFIGEEGTEHVGTVVGYAESGYCGDVKVVLRANYQIDSTGLRQQCSLSWLAFF